MGKEKRSYHIKKVLSICLFLSLATGCLFTGCGASETPDSPVETTATTEAETTEAVTETEAETEQTDVETEVETTAEEATEAAETTTAKASVDSSSDGLWADFDRMTFSVNGKTYTLGETTLQEMIDDGVPFEEDDLANAGNNVNPNYESSSFNITLGEYAFAQVRVLNDTSENKPANECYIDSIYMPVDLEQPQDILQFNFPFTMTKEDLLANSGEPEDPDNIYVYESEDGSYKSESFTYRKESEKYYGDSTYHFEFANGALRYVTISYTP